MPCSKPQEKLSAYSYIRAFMIIVDVKYIEDIFMLIFFWSILAEKYMTGLLFNVFKLIYFCKS